VQELFQAVSNISLPAVRFAISELCVDMVAFITLHRVRCGFINTDQMRLL
jgi:hypothetical protein